MWASDLARHVGVAQTTIANWTSASKYQPPLAFVMENGHRTFSLDEYKRFAQAHPDLRGVGRRETTTGTNPVFEQVRGELQQLLTEIEVTIQGSEQTGTSARELKKKLNSLMTRLPKPSHDS